MPDLQDRLVYARWLVDEWRGTEGREIEREWGPLVRASAEWSARRIAMKVPMEGPEEGPLRLTDRELAEAIDRTVSSLRNSIHGTRVMRFGLTEEWTSQMEKIRECLRTGQPLPTPEGDRRR